MRSLTISVPSAIAAPFDKGNVTNGVLVLVVLVVVVVVVAFLVLNSQPPSNTSTLAAKVVTSEPPSTSAAEPSSSMPYIIALILAITCAVVFWVFPYVRRFFFGGGAREESNAEEDLRAELAIKNTGKNAPGFFAVAIEITDAVHADKSMTEDQRDSVYRQILDVSRSGDLRNYKDTSRFSDFQIPQSAIDAAEASIQVKDIRKGWQKDNLKPSDMKDKKDAALKNVPEPIRIQVSNMLDKAIAFDESVILKGTIDLTVAQKTLLEAQEQEDITNRTGSKGLERLFGVPKKIKNLADRKAFEGIRMVLEGGPGLGKSDSVYALLKERPNLHIIRLNGKDLGDKRGTAAVAVANAVAVCEWYQRQGKESVLFLDEGNEVLKDGEFQNQLQTLTGKKKLNIIITTNYYSMLPWAIRGRMDRVSYTTPDKKTRMNIMRAELADIVSDGTAVLETDINYKTLGETRLGGRDISMAMAAARDAAEKVAANTLNEVVITHELLKSAIRDKYASKSRKERIMDRVQEFTGR
jgi:hypothetical protein